MHHQQYKTQYTLVIGRIEYFMESAPQDPPQAVGTPQRDSYRLTDILAEGVTVHAVFTFVLACDITIPTLSNGSNLQQWAVTRHGEYIGPRVLNVYKASRPYGSCRRFLPAWSEF